MIPNITNLRDELRDIGKRITAIEKELDDAIPNWDDGAYNLSLAQDEIETAIEQINEAIQREEEEETNGNSST